MFIWTVISPNSSALHGNIILSDNSHHSVRPFRATGSRQRTLLFRSASRRSPHISVEWTVVTFMFVLSTLAFQLHHENISLRPANTSSVCTLRRPK